MEEFFRGGGGTDEMIGGGGGPPEIGGKFVSINPVPQHYSAQSATASCLTRAKAHAGARTIYRVAVRSRIGEISGWMRAILLSLICVVFASNPLLAADVHVFAAASLTDVLKVIATDYEKTSSDKIIFNFGASSFLARQIIAGAPADIFFSADEARMDDLEKDGLIRKETRKNRLSNSLVIVTASDSSVIIGSASDLSSPAIKRLALADPRTVPAGVYARQYLEKIGVWKAVSGKVIPTDNVRAALSAVEAGNVEAAIVYKTDARISKRTKVALEIPPSEGPSIHYPMAMLRDSKQPSASSAFFTHLAGSQAAASFARFGFIVIN